MSASAKEAINRASSWFNDRPIRERALIAVTILVLLLVVGWELAVTPVAVQNERLETQLNLLSSQQQSLVDQQNLLMERLATDPSQKLRDTLSVRRARLERLDQELADTTGRLIAPRAMVTLLRDILTAQDELELVAVELLEPTPIFAETAQSDDESGDAGAEEARTEGPLLYAHDVELVVRGGYLNVLNYVESLESMDKRLGWVSLDYEMQDYPNNEIRIRVRTLSLDRAWLGV